MSSSAGAPASAASCPGDGTPSLDGGDLPPPPGAPAPDGRERTVAGPIGPGHTAGPAGHDDIDRYLRSLADSLGRRVVDSARLVEEAEEHLRDAQDDLVAHGWSPDAAAAAAVERFGGPDAVARRLPLIGGPVGRQVVRALAPLLAVAMVAIGVGGLLALVVTWAVGHPPGGPGPSRAALSAQTLVGVVGLGILETLWRRRSTRPARPSGLPARFVPAAGVVSFGLATAALGAYALLLAWWDRSHHMSRPLTTAFACFGAAVFYGVQLVQRRVARNT